MAKAKTQTMVVEMYGRKRSHQVPEGWTPIAHTIEGRWLYVDGFVYDIQELDDYGLRTRPAPRPKPKLAKPRVKVTQTPRPSASHPKDEQ